MPPKKGGGDKGGGAPKVKIDKTFGMKNKKGAKAQQQIKIIQQQQSQAGLNREALAKQKRREEEKRIKAEESKRIKEAGPMYGLVQPKVPFGVDPKSVTCVFWRAGCCEKGSKCKYGHSENAERKSQKKDLYVDTREQELEAKKNDTMDKWDQDQLNKVINTKHTNPRSTTDKVCKYFLQAVEDGKYGWFWECPNGGEKCMYRHRLPPGYVLKTERKEREALEKANEISLEEFLESARHKLGSNLTPVTPESFAKWKQERQDKKRAEEEALSAKKSAQAQANKLAGLSGREMFALNPEVFGLDDDDEDDGAVDMASYMGSNWEQGRDDEADVANGVARLSANDA